MRNSRLMGLKAKLIAMASFFLICLFLIPGNGQDEKKDVSTIVLLDCSGSMVDSIHRDMESRGLLKSYKEGQSRLFSLPEERISPYLNNPDNKNILSENIMVKSCEALEKLIKDYSQGPVVIMTFRDGLVDMDGDAPLKKSFSVYVDPDKPESKQYILKFINPMKYGKLDNAPMWNGLLWETIRKGGGPTQIKKSCKIARDLFDKNTKKQGFVDKTRAQKLILITDGKEMEKGSTFQKVLDFYEFEQKESWYEYPKHKDDFSKVTLKISANSLKGSLKENSLTPPAYKAEVDLSPAVKISAVREDNSSPRGQIALSVSKDSASLPLPAVLPSSIEARNLNKETKISFLFSDMKSFFNTLANEKEVLYRINIVYKSAQDEKPVNDETIPVSVKMIPADKRITIVPPAGFESKSAPDGVVWEIADAKDFKAKYSFAVDYSRAPDNSSVLVELLKDPPSKGLKLVRGPETDKIALLPDTGKKAAFDVLIDLESPEEKITAVLSAKAMPSSVNIVPSKASFSIVNPMKIFKIVWKDNQNQDAQAPKSIDYGKIKLKQIRSGNFPKPPVSAFAILAERSDLFPANTPVDVSLEGSITSVMGLKIQGAGKGEISLKNWPPDKLIQLGFQEYPAPGQYSGTLVVSSSGKRVDIQPSDSKRIPVSIEIQKGGLGFWIWLIIIIILFLLILLAFRKKEEKEPKAAVTKPAQTP